MKIKMVHNYYIVRGGEDSVYENELELLSRNTNVDVRSNAVTNTEIATFWDKLFALLLLPYNFLISKRLSEPDDDCLDVVHVHNHFPLITPSVFHFFKRRKVATVHTLHNYRSICPTALLMFAGKPCEKSINHSAWWALKHRVYRESWIGTLVLIIQIEAHKKLGTWQREVDRFICLTEFSRQKFIEAGFPEHKLVVKPNFVCDPGYDELTHKRGNPLFVGRLSAEKGLNVLASASDLLNINVDVAGEGVQIKSQRLNYLGKCNKEAILLLMRHSPFLIMPSIWYEGFPMVIVEAFACGTPVICSRLGSMAEIVEDGVTGLHFNAGDDLDLASKINYLYSNPNIALQMGRNARKVYLEKYTPEINLKILLDIYSQAVTHSRREL